MILSVVTEKLFKVTSCHIP